MKFNAFWIAVFLFGDFFAAYAQTSNPDLLAQARKEGRVAWYTTVSIPESQEFVIVLLQRAQESAPAHRLCGIVGLR